MLSNPRTPDTQPTFLITQTQRIPSASVFLPASQDDVPEAVKQRRLTEIIDVYRSALYRRNAAEAGRTHLVLVEGPSRRSGALRGLGCRLQHGA